MGPVAASTSIKDDSLREKVGLAHVLLILPLLGMLGLICVASHRVAKPDISIFEAIDEGNYSAVRDHILTGTSINSVNQSGHTPLFVAINDRKPQIVQLLLKNGASATAENKGQLTPLYEAAGQGNLDLIRQLLAKGARADEVYVNGTTALQAAANSNNLQAVELLLQGGAKVNAVSDNNGGSALCNAVIRGNLPITKLLLKNGADVKLKGPLGRTPLHFAASSGDVRLVRLLLDHGAVADARDKDNLIPLAYSLEKGDSVISRLLLTKTKDVTVVRPANRYNLLHYAVLGHCDTGIIKDLVDRGCDANESNDFGDTPLTLAYDQNNEGLIKVLSANGARVPLSYLIRIALSPPPTRSKGGFTSVE